MAGKDGWKDVVAAYQRRKAIEAENDFCEEDKDGILAEWESELIQEP